MSKSSSIARDDRRPPLAPSLTRVGARVLLGVVAYGGLLFLAAGTFDWRWGWAFLGVMAAVAIAEPLLLLARAPALLAERSRGYWNKGVKPWDKRITAAAGGLMLLSWTVAALDVRAGWTAPPPVVHVAGLVLVCGGYALFLRAMDSNPYFVGGVRIQSERGHRVIADGPYRVVRHPGYAGTILAQFGTPLLLGSIWALLPASALIALLVLRTRLEDRTLMRELDGYADYTRLTRFRLVPGVW